MKIRSRFLIRLLARGTALGSRALFASTRRRVKMGRPGICAYREYGGTRDDRFLYCLWHDAILGVIFTGRATTIGALTSRHADGDLIAEALAAINVPVIRGSSNRGGAAAIRQMLDAADDYHLAIATDGPRGPRHVVKEGIVYLASQTGRGIVPCGFAADPAWKPRGKWTDLTVPKPFSNAVLCLGEPLYVPGDLDRGELEPYRRRLQQAMEATDAQAWRMVAAETPRPDVTRRAA